MKTKIQKRFGVGTIWAILLSALFLGGVFSGCDVEKGKVKTPPAPAPKPGEPTPAPTKAPTPQPTPTAAAAKPACAIEKGTILIAELMPASKKSSQDRDPIMDHVTGQKAKKPGDKPPTDAPTAAPESQPESAPSKNEDPEGTKTAPAAAEAKFGILILRDAANYKEFNDRLRKFEEKQKADSLSFLIDLRVGANLQPAMRLTTEPAVANLMATWKSAGVRAKDSDQEIALKAHIDNLIKDTNSKFSGQAIDAMSISIAADAKDAKKSTFKLQFNNKDKGGKEQICTAETVAVIEAFKAEEAADKSLHKITLADGAQGKWEDVKKDEKKDDKKETKKDETKK